MRLPHITSAKELDIALIGIPYDGGATYRSGPRFGPRNVRAQSCMIRPWNPVLNVDPFSKWRVGDYGDLSVNPLSLDDTFNRITSQLNDVLAAGARTLSVGGDHSILLPILRSIHKKFGPVALVQFDAQRYLGRLFRQLTFARHSGSPRSGRRPADRRQRFASRSARTGLLEDDFEFGRKHKFSVITAEEFHRGGLAPVEKILKRFRGKQVYFTLDIDVVDPAFAPGTGTPQVGGLSSFQILELVRCLKGQNLVGADLVEVSPPYDNGEITSLLAANLLFEMLCVF
jgi:guanidinobutyrase